MKTKRTPAAQVRRALFDAARVVLARDGVKGLTVRAVAAQAGVAPMGVYNHFDGKDGLLESVVADGFERLRDEIRGVDTADPRVRLREAGRRYRAFALDNPTLYRLMFSGSCDVDMVGAEALVALTDLIRFGQATGVIRDEDPLSLTMQIWSCVHGAVSLELDSTAPDHELLDNEANYEALLGLIERGVRP